MKQRFSIVVADDKDLRPFLTQLWKKTRGERSDQVADIYSIRSLSPDYDSCLPCVINEDYATNGNSAKLMANELWIAKGGAKVITHASVLILDLKMPIELGRWLGVLMPTATQPSPTEAVIGGLGELGGLTFMRHLPGKGRPAR